MSARKLTRKSLVDQVVDALIDMIDSGHLKPGDKLPSTQSLIKEFGVSRPVVREALKALEGRGIIDIANGRNPTVKPLSADILQRYFQRAVAMEDKTLLDILEVRHGIEVQTARLAAKRRKPEEIAQLKKLVKEMRDHLDDSDVYTDLDLKFHLQIASATQNKMLYYLVESIRDVLRDTIQEGLRHRLSEHELQLVQSTHEDIVSKLEAGDADGAANAMAFHFDDAIRAIFYTEED